MLGARRTHYRAWRNLVQMSVPSVRWFGTRPKQFDRLSFLAEREAAPEFYDGDLLRQQ